MPRIRLIAGPNGAGKTTLLRTLVDEKVPVGQYINPDDIARHIDLSTTLSRVEKEVGRKTKWPPITPETNGYFSVLLAQTIATNLRQDWLGYKLSLTYESVMSHESHFVVVKCFRPVSSLDYFRASVEGFLYIQSSYGDFRSGGKCRVDGLDRWIATIPWAGLYYFYETY